MSDMKQIINDSFTNYSGAVLQSRALVDVRDCVKPSARQIFYSMFQRKLTHDKPFKKTNNAIGMAMADYYIHGDNSCEGIIMRAAQPFAMRYPFVEVEGSYGDIKMSGNWAAPRYTSSRLAPITSVLFEDIDKDVITEWRDNYDDTKQYPSVLSSKGFYNIVNGTMGIGVGAASSIPQFNLKEVNDALIKLLWNPDIDFEEIYCCPDFATGGYLLNEAEVKESLKKGTGFSCKLRSVVEYDEKEKCFVVTQIPFSVYTSTIRDELNAIISSDKNPGIEKYNDLTNEEPLIKIYLSKRANPDKVLAFLYKNTSLQSYYGINMTMLKDGRFPKVFTWKEALQEHINHEIMVYKRGFEFDLKKIEKRLHIIDGLKIALANIEEVVKIIKSSSTTAAASKTLQSNYNLDSEQAKAILDMKLSRLAHLEIEKLEKEEQDLLAEADRLKEILDNETLLKQEIEKGFTEVSKKYGDSRRTKVLNVGGDEEENIEQKQLTLSFTNEGAVFVAETSTLYSQKRNGVGTKFKLENGEYVVDTLVGDNTDTIMFFTNKGNLYHTKMNNFDLGEKQYINRYVTIADNEEIVSATILGKSNDKKNILFITKNGIAKKSLLSEYNLKRNTGSIAIKLDAKDEITSVLFIDEEPIGILTEKGNFVMIETKDIRAIGRVARGVVGVKLNDGDKVVSAKVITTDVKEIVSISKDGYAKRTLIEEFKITGRGTKGVKIQNSDKLVDFLPICTEQEILVVSSKAQLKVKLNEISLLGRGALGVKTIKLSETSKIIKICSL